MSPKMQRREFITLLAARRLRSRRVRNRSAGFRLWLLARPPAADGQRFAAFGSDPRVVGWKVATSR
jgi:hypothetical protein